MVVKESIRPGQRFWRAGFFDFTEGLLLVGLAAGAKLLNLW